VDHEIKEFAGTYAEWVAWKERMERQDNRKNTIPEKAKEKTPEEPKKPEEEKPAAARPINKELKKELQKQQKIFQQLEEKIQAINKQQAELQSSLQLPEVYADREKFLQTEAELKKLGQELSGLNKQYEEVFERIVELESTASN
jgi:ATP-binding cassette subfamily F protein 3